MKLQQRFYFSLGGESLLNTDKGWLWGGSKPTDDVFPRLMFTVQSENSKILFPEITKEIQGCCVERGNGNYLFSPHALKTL